jgi:hypothetical protein
LESVAANTNVILPPRFLEIVTGAIESDGLSLARVAPELEMELTKYGGQDPIDMLKFRVACFPIDSSSWKILEMSLFAVVKRLHSRINKVSLTSDDVNVFHDILMTLLRRHWKSMVEIVVCHSSNQFRMRIVLRSLSQVLQARILVTYLIAVPLCSAYVLLYQIQAIQPLRLFERN